MFFILAVCECTEWVTDISCLITKLKGSSSVPAETHHTAFPQWPPREAQDRRGSLSFLALFSLLLPSPPLTACLDEEGLSAICIYLLSAYLISLEYDHGCWGWTRNAEYESKPETEPLTSPLETLKSVQVFKLELTATCRQGCSQRRNSNPLPSTSPGAWGPTFTLNAPGQIQSLTLGSLMTSAN